MKLSAIYILVSSANLVLSTHVSKNGKCGTISEQSYTCLRSSFGNCCSQYGYCGSSDAYCDKRCQSAYGSCNKASASSARPTSTSKSKSSAQASLSSLSTVRTSTQVRTSSASMPAPSTSVRVSRDGKCGKGVTCLGSGFGDCCSEHGYCGKSPSYCNAGCQFNFGSCTSTRPGDVSTDATCGGSKGYNCIGSAFGSCCSRWGFCGFTSSYCGEGCQSTFGECTPRASSIQSSQSTTSSSTVSRVSVPPGSTVLTSSASSTLVPSSVSLPVGSLSSNAEISSSQSSSMISSVSSSSKPSLSTSISETSSSNADLPTPTTSSSLPALSTALSSSIAASTLGSTSSSSSDTPSPTSSAPSCPTNYVKNGGFEQTDSVLSDFGVRVVNGAASVSTRSGSNTIAGPGSGSFYLEFRTVSSPTVTLSQTLTGVTAGTTVNCGLLANYPGDNDALLEAAQITMIVDGQLCGTFQSYLTQGWQALSSSNTVTVTVDAPVVQVSSYLDNFFGYQLVLGLDNISVTKADGNPVC